MADNDSPWCHNNINCIAKASHPLHASTALKDGTCSINSQKIPLQLFFKKSLPGFPLLPSCQCHWLPCHYDSNQPPHKTHPYLSPPLATINHIPQPFLKPAANNSFDYKSKLVELDAEIELMKCSWHLSIALHHNTCNCWRVLPTFLAVLEEPRTDQKKFQS